jgi:hypothetical protein
LEIRKPVTVVLFNSIYLSILEIILFFNHRPFIRLKEAVVLCALFKQYIDKKTKMLLLKLVPKLNRASPNIVFGIIKQVLDLEDQK